MSYERQVIDCNCNDCIFMVRNTDKQKASIEFNIALQKSMFDRSVEKVRRAANLLKDRKNDLEAWDNLHTQADNMKFQPNKKAANIGFGKCIKFDKDVSFLPNTCRPDNQKCFKHRKDNDNPTTSHDKI